MNEPQNSLVNLLNKSMTDLSQSIVKLTEAVNRLVSASRGDDDGFDDEPDTYLDGTPR